MKLCVIGCGDISNHVHGPSYVKYREDHADYNFHTAACCDLRLDIAQKYAERFGFSRAYDDFEKMIEAERPDAVCITVSESAAAFVGVRILEMGIPMLIEKPPGKTTEELHALCMAAEHKSTPNLVAFNRRFMPIITEAKKRIAQWKRQNRPILSVHYSMYRVGRNDEDFSDTAIHAIDTARFLSGDDYVRVNFTRGNVLNKRPQTVLMDAIMSNGVTVCIKILPNSGMNLERAEIHSDGGTICLGLPTNGANLDEFGWIEEYENDVLISKNTDISGVTAESDRFIACGFYHENALFFDSVRNGTVDMLNQFALDKSMNTMLVKEAYARGENIYEI